MARQNYVFTSESVSEGHPDKLCDQISDAVLDALLAEDPAARVACETFATTGTVVSAAARACAVAVRTRPTASAVRAAAASPEGARGVSPPNTSRALCAASPR